MKNFIGLLLLVAVFSASGQNGIRLSDLNNKTTITGTEKIPVSGSGNPSITPNLLKTFLHPGTIDQIAYWSGANDLGALTTVTYPSLSELAWVKGVTSSIQTQINGKQATLVSGTNIKTINGSSVLGSGDLTIGGTSYLLQSSQPSSTSDIWVDTGNAYAGAYPIRKYINGAWQTVSEEMDYYDPIGGVISNGRPYIIAYSGQSNVASSFYYPDSYYGASYTGDVTKDNYVTTWNSDLTAFKVYDFADQSGSSGTDDIYSWELNLGANNLQSFGKSLARNTGRSVRFVGARRGGTPLAAWEAGALMWTNLVGVLNASGVTRVDGFVWIQGEGGLTSVEFPTSLFASYRLSFMDFISRLKSNSWTNGTLFDGKTIIIAPSQALAYSQTVIPIAEVDGAEATIRALDLMDSPYYGWVKTNYARIIQTPLSGASTSSTSVNLTTVTAPFSITIGTGLTSSYPISINNPVAIVATSDRSQWLYGTVSAYNSGTGLLTFSTIEFSNGAGAYTSWSVLPQDRYHWTTLEQERIGKSMYERFSSLMSYKKNQPPYTTFQISDGLGKLTKSIIAYPQADDTQMLWSSRTNNAGKFDIGFSTASSVPTTILRFGATGSSSNSYVAILQTASNTELSRWNTVGLLQSSPIYWRYTGAAGLDTRIEMSSDGTYSPNIVGGTTGSLLSSIRFTLGATQVGRFYENAGNGHRFDIGGPAGLAHYNYNVASKLSRVTETRGALNGALTASASQTSTIFVNTPITDIPPFSVIEIELTVVGVTSTGGAAFSAKKSAMFTVANYGVVTMLSEDATTAVKESTAGIMPSTTTGLSFSVVSGQISATLTRGATAGTFNFSSVAVATIKTF